MKIPKISKVAFQHVWDIVVRSVKTGLATYAAVVASGGLDVLHVGTKTQVQLAGLATVATAVLNISLKVHQAVTQSAQTPPPIVETLPPPVA